MTRRNAIIGLATLAQAAAQPEPGICIFSKHLQWAGWQEMAAVAAQIGFDGVDLTVRPGGHVEPARVAEDLPKAAAVVRQAGLKMPMITASIVDADSPHAEAILAAASGLGIRRYRWGGFKYVYGRNIAEQLEALKPRVNGLARLNEKYGIAAMYHCHSGPGEVGAPVWDIWTVLRETDPRWLGLNYDIGHATVEGGYGGWIDSAHLVEKRMLGVALKDVLWAKDPKQGWVPHWCPLGDGMVRFPDFFRILKSARFEGPLQLHFEYPLGGAENGNRNLTIPKEQVVAAMQRDLRFVREQMKLA